MLNISEMNSYNTFTNEEAKQFLKVIKGHKYECFFKLIMTYQISRIELVCLEWKDIDFENNTITIYSIEQERIKQSLLQMDVKQKRKFMQNLSTFATYKKLTFRFKIQK